MRNLTKRSAVVAIAALAGLATITVGTPGEASHNRVTQEAPVNWHPQSGNAGAVGEGVEASLVRSRNGIRYKFDTTGLVPGNAYTMWIVVVNDPSACDATPCTPPQIIGDPAVDGQVSLGSRWRGRTKRRDRALPLADRSRTVARWLAAGAGSR